MITILSQLARSLAFVFVLYMVPAQSQAQGSTPVNWNLETEQLPNHEIMLSITAAIAPGWHLYSQHLKEGGPQPTRFRFDQSDDYIVTGQAGESGNQTTFYDDIYEMEITWYSKTATFLRKFRLNEPVTTITGEVEYMACNNQICVPEKRQFEINVNLIKKDP